MDCDLTKMIQRRLYFWGSYEEEACHHWINLSREAKIAFDVGANVGLYSLLAASANPECNVYAFEPTPELAIKLTENTRLNSIRNIVVEVAALGNSDHTGYLQVCRGSDGTNEGMNYVTSVPRDGSDLPVKVVSLDQYCQRRGIARINLLKMDIEGGEYDALVGAQQLLQTQSIDCIFLELIGWAANRSGHSTLEIQDLLLDAGYCLYRLRSGRLVPIAVDTVVDGENIIALIDRREPLWRQMR
jgi:FkbM family methyltransferase